MLDKVITSLTANYHKLSDRLVFIWLLVLSVLIRLPFFFRDYIDRDESTFILVAQSWVDGHLPYTELWDLKPPLVYLFFASIISIFGKSFIAIRAIGALGIAFTAFFTYKIGKELKSGPMAFWAATACVYLLSLFGSLQGVMSEHLSMMFFVPALFILIKYDNLRWFFISGLLLGLSLMMKLNLAYAVLVIGVFFLIRAIKEGSIVKEVWKLTMLAIGVLLVIGITILPYYHEGIAHVWYNSVFLAPLEYSNMIRSSFFELLPACILFGGFFLISWKKQWLSFSDSSTQLLTLVVIGILVSFLKSGKINGHYLMQVYPMMLLLVGIVLTNTLSFHKNYVTITISLLLLLPLESYREYVAVIKNYTIHNTFFNGEGFTVPNFIRERKLNTSDILFFEYHIGYWIIDEQPPTKASTHPSNICRDELFPLYDNPRNTSMEELQYLLDTLQPITIITRSNKRVFNKDYIAENTYVNRYLEDHYILVDSVDKADVYRRLQ
ncbi:MAG: glycosyltransferase family 39 protein [Muriicola sp.]|nr:glycosyltransferase family 39 protein [Muriicola sp.]